MSATSWVLIHALLIFFDGSETKLEGEMDDKECELVFEIKLWTITTSVNAIK